jgi:general secretion pathway protein F
MEFEVTAIFPGQGVSQLRVNADSAEQVGTLPALAGGVIVAVTAAGSTPRSQRRGRFPLVLFARQLLSLVRAGLTVVEGIETLAEQDRGSPMSAALDRLLGRLHEGQSLANAMQEDRATFPDLFVATIRASERTGDLPEALQRYVVFHERLAELKKKIVSAAIYPALLMAVGGIVTLFLLGYVVPRFTLVFADSGRAPEGPSALLFALGDLINSRAPELALGALVLTAALAGLASHPAVRGATMRAAWRMPALGERLRLVYLARFYRTTGMLLRAGIPLKTALGMVGELLPAALREGLAMAREAIEHGQPFSRAAERGGLTTPVAMRMVAVGERSGQLGEMMESVADFYDEEIRQMVEHLTRLFEPLLMAVIGAVIGGVVLLLYMPIFELAGNFQ